jgi:hypothetical protein
MLNQLRRKELIRKKIIYLTDRVSENKLLQSILDEYIYLNEQNKPQPDQGKPLFIKHT